MPERRGEYFLYKLHFRAAVHIGNGNLTDGEYTLPADSLFSALCHAALRRDGETGIAELVKAAKTGRLLLSDALPFIGQDFYIPKPAARFTRDEAAQESSGDKKAFKKLKYLPVSLLSDYLAGDFDAEAELEKQARLGTSDVRTMVDVRRVAATGEPPRPFSLGAFRFFGNAGLYTVVSCEGECGKFVESLLEFLACSGVGGERSSGFGRFDLEPASCPDLTDLLETQSPEAVGNGRRMTLSVAMARPEELKQALEGASYVLKKRSGFVSSPDYADSPLKKRDFYSFAAGACFENFFEGDVFDVSQEGGRHPVYRYAKPMFMKFPEIVREGSA